MLMQTFEWELQRLQDELLALGSILESAIIESVDVLKRPDLADSWHLIALSRRINKKRFAIEMDCVRLIVTQQPMDGDLWSLTSILGIAAELECVGEYTQDIAKFPFTIIMEESLLDLLMDIQRMAAKTQNMLHRALQAFVQRDLSLAQAIPAEDDEVDALYHQVYQDWLAFVKGNSRVKDNSRELVNQARHLARIARNVERVADRVAHICDWVTFAATGKMAGVDEERALSSTEYPFSLREVPEGDSGERSHVL
jgi:phosphate transport system protein